MCIRINHYWSDGLEPSDYKGVKDENMQMSVDKRFDCGRFWEDMV